MGYLETILALTLAACHTPARPLEFCRAVERGEVLSCAPCDATATIDGQAANALARDAHQALLAEERSTSLLSGPPASDEPFYYRSDTGPLSVDGAVATSRESADREVSARRPRVHYFELTTSGYSGNHSVQVVVKHYMRDWIDDERRVFDAPPHVTYYCASREATAWTFKALMDY